MKTVEEFYSNFNFQDMVLGDEAGEPPALLKEFFQKDIEYIQKMKKQEKVLEVGCGFGRLLRELSKKSEKVVGIDFSDLQLDQAKINLADCKKVSLVKMKAENLGFQNDFFNTTICMNSSLGNMPGIEEKVLEEMVRVTKPKGTIVIRVFADSEEVKKAQFQNYQRLGMTNIKDDGRAVRTDEGFYSRRFKKEELINMFKTLGLEYKITKDCDAGYLVVAEKI